MYFGHLVELGPAEEVFNNPMHPYTKQLINAIPSMEVSDEPVWDANEEFEDFEFQYDQEGEQDPDWIEVGPEHFIATTLKDREVYYKIREEQSHEFARSE